MREAAIRAAFRTQANFCRQTGSALTGAVLDALAGVLSPATRTGARILSWPGDPLVDALMLRITGGLNALARSGQDHELTALYAIRDSDFSAVLARVMVAWDDWLFPWLDSAPQTNEVARSGVLWPGMLEIARRFGPKLELLELGASGGLNLNMDRFSYNLGGTLSGDPQFTVHLAPAWTGAAPPAVPVEIAARAGVDLNPLDMADPAVAEQMLAYIWPDQHERVARAQAAIAIARAHVPLVEKADGADWIEERLTRPQAAGVTRVVFHSIALVYFPPADRARVNAAISAAGARATAARPLVWLQMEFPGKVTQADLSLTCWPGNGTPEILAKAHPHGAKIDWLVDR